MWRFISFYFPRRLPRWLHCAIPAADLRAQACRCNPRGLEFTAQAHGQTAVHAYAKAKAQGAVRTYACMNICVRMPFPERGLLRSLYMSCYMYHCMLHVTSTRCLSLHTHPVDEITNAMLWVSNYVDLRPRRGQLCSRTGQLRHP